MHDYSASYSHSKPVSWLSRLSVSLCDNIVKRTIKVQYIPHFTLSRAPTNKCCWMLFFFFYHKEYVKALTFQVLWRSGSEINNICEGSWHVASFSLYWGTFPTGLLVASEASHFINWKKKKKFKLKSGHPGSKSCVLDICMESGQHIENFPCRSNWVTLSKVPTDWLRVCLLRGQWCLEL